MIAFINHPAGLLHLRFETSDLAAIKTLSPRIHADLMDGFVVAQVLGRDNGTKKAVEIAISAQFTDGRTLVHDRETGAFDLECSGATSRQKDADGLEVQNLTAVIKHGALTLVETDKSVRTAFTPKNSNRSVKDGIIALLEEGPMTEDAIVLAMPAMAPREVRQVLHRLMKLGKVVHDADGLRYEPFPAPPVEPPARALPKEPLPPTPAQIVREVFKRHGLDTSLSAAAVVHETGFSKEETDQILASEVAGLRLFREGMGYRLPSHAARNQLNDRIAELLALSITHFNSKGLTEAEIRQNLEEFAPEWITRTLETMIGRKQITLKGDVYIFNEPDVTNRGSGLNKIRTVLKNAGEGGLAPRQAMDLLPEIKPQLIHWNLQELVLRGRARFENDRFYWIFPKPKTPKIGFRYEVFEFIASQPDEYVSHAAIFEHFNDLPRNKVTIALSDLQERGYISLRKDSYRVREDAPSIVSNASANATP